MTTRGKRLVKFIQYSVKHGQRESRKITPAPARDRLANVTITFSPRSQNNSIPSSPRARQSNLIHQLTNRLLICPQLYRYSQPSRSIQPFTGRTGL